MMLTMRIQSGAATKSTQNTGEKKSTPTTTLTQANHLHRLPWRTAEIPVAQALAPARVYSRSPAAWRPSARSEYSSRRRVLPPLTVRT